MFHSEFKANAGAAARQASAAVVVSVLAGWAGAVRAAAEIQEVLVTAQKRSESLQEVPLSVQLLSEDRLEKASLRGTDDLAQVTPGLTMTRQITSSTPVIRGVGSVSPGSGGENTVATYVDGVYLTQAQASVITFNNIEAVEVLKGPQGTLYGRNATGGLIHVKTRDPSTDALARMKVGYGNYEAVEGALYATTGIADGVAADIAVYYSDQSEGFGRYRTANAEHIWSKIASARSKWLFGAGGDTQVRVIADYSKTEGDLGLSRRPNDRDAAYANVNFYDSLAFLPARGENVSKGLSVQIDHAFDKVSFKSITAFRDSHTVSIFDLFAQPAHLIDVFPTNAADTYTQEFQLTSAHSGPFQWVAGAFYMEDNNGFPDFRVVLNPALTGAPVPLVAASRVARQELRNASVYADGSYAFADSTKLTLGLRWTQDERNVGGTTDRRQVGGPLTVIPNTSSKDDAVTYRAVLEHALSDNVFAYGSFSTGYKSGNFNNATLGDTAVPIPIKPEDIDAWELGLKSMLARGRLRLNAAGFFYEYENLQVFRTVGTTTLIDNAANAEIKGLEVEGQALIGERFELDFGVSILDSEYTKYTNAPGFASINGSNSNLQIVTPANEAAAIAAGNPLVTSVGNTAFDPITGARVNGVDASGNELRISPDYTLNVGGRYTVPVGGGEVTAAANYYYNDGFFWDPQNRSEQSSYGLLNASIGWTSTSGNLTLTLWGKNLTDEEYIMQCQCADTSGDLGSPAPPLTYGVAFAYSFGASRR
jgi:iron complex outermembrane receptor protein